MALARTALPAGCRYAASRLRLGDQRLSSYL